VPQNAGIHVIKQGVVIAAGKALHGVVLADKITGCDIGNGKDLGLERLGLFLGIGIVHKRENDVFILQRADDLVELMASREKLPMISRQAMITQIAAKDMNPWVKTLPKPSLR
jgi:hypothetical protein